MYHRLKIKSVKDFKLQIQNLTLIILLFCIPIIMEGQNYQWAKSFKGTGDDYNGDIAVDDNGNIYCIGNLKGTCDFDPGFDSFNLTSAGDFDIYLSKLDVNGNFVWAKKIGSNREDVGFAITLDNSGNIYATGWFTGTVDFDPGIATYNLTCYEDNCFILKLDPGGNFIWAKKFENSNYYYGFSIATDANGNVYTTGYFQNTVDFDPSTAIYYLTSAGGPDIFISKLDAKGNFVWAKKLGGRADDFGTSIKVDLSENVYVTGTFQETADFDPSSKTFELISVGGTDLFISKLDANGNFVWAKNFGGSTRNFSTHSDLDPNIELGKNATIYIIGSFLSTVDFDPGVESKYLTSNGGFDIFILKLETNGNFVWAKNFGGIKDEAGDLAIDTLGNIYLTGYFQGTVDFDPGVGNYSLTPKGISDIFISQLDTNGNFKWAKSIGGTGNDSGAWISVSSGNIFITGYFEGTVDFNPPLSSNLKAIGTYDIFIAKYTSNLTGTIENNYKPDFCIYPNPTKCNVDIDLREQTNFTKVIVTNFSGQEIINKNYFNESAIHLQIEGESGIYFITVKTQNKLVTKKILKI
ncbi:MAG: hypothetical protein JPMHGGIA_01461 [Saprospiraceae bacterium]|jgi:hypothetical protein|nr:hypothetical protein [Saprospiraceae bacterium]